MFYLFSIIALVLDQTSKYLVKSGFWVTKRIPIIGEYFFLEVSKNTGVAFSMPIEGSLLKILTLILITGIIIYFFRFEELRKNRYIQAGYGMIVGGAVSHAYERIFHGYVLDFIGVKYFAIFNFADIFITVGAIILILIHLREYGSRKAD